MSDLRVQKFAKVLVEHSTRVEPGDRVLIEGTTAAEPLVRELVQIALDDEWSAMRFRRGAPDVGSA